MDNDDTYLNKIDAPTSLQIRLLAPQDNPVIDVLLQWASTPSAADLDQVARLGGVWNRPPTAAAGPAPTDLQTLRLPLRVLADLARLPSVRALSAAAPLAPDTDDGPPADGIRPNP